jgi:hypothetical protein
MCSRCRWMISSTWLQSRMTSRECWMLGQGLVSRPMGLPLRDKSRAADDMSRYLGNVSSRDPLVKSTVTPIADSGTETLQTVIPQQKVHRPFFYLKKKTKNLRTPWLRLANTQYSDRDRSFSYPGTQWAYAHVLFREGTMQEAPSRRLTSHDQSRYGYRPTAVSRSTTARWTGRGRITPSTSSTRASSSAPSPTGRACTRRPSARSSLAAGSRTLSRASTSGPTTTASPRGTSCTSTYDAAHVLFLCCPPPPPLSGYRKR